MSKEENSVKTTNSHSVLIYPNQLFEHHPLLQKGNTTVFLIEEPLMFTQYAFHCQKILFHRASMKAYEQYLKDRGHTVVYVESKQIEKTEDIAFILNKHGITHVDMCDVVDNWLEKKLLSSIKKVNITFTIHETPLFLTSVHDLDLFFKTKLLSGKKVLMKSFYEWQRKRMEILIDEEGMPTGGKWSYDEDNRKKLPKGYTPKSLPRIYTNSYIEEAKEYVRTNFDKNYGNYENMYFPVTHDEAKKQLDDFLRNTLERFGPCEDAVSKSDPFINHSLLSPLLNSGLLTPDYVIEKTLKYDLEHTVLLSSLEGFIRQIIGWREYVRAMYIFKGTEIRNKNYFNHTKELEHSFWTGNTGIDPVDDTIKTTLEYAYSHHITRLMIMGNFMNLCGYKPDGIYKWFMEMYIDAYDWVMVPNVYSMALYADGGLITSKPYISSSRYVISMSDYKKGKWSEQWDSLYWDFIDTHYAKLSNEGRLGFVGMQFAKMDPDKLKEYKRIAKEFLG